MKVIFMGSGHFACYQLEALHNDKDIEVLAVVTQPKKIVGRKKELKGTLVYDLANDLGYQVVEAGKSKDIQSQIDLAEADFLVVADYGVILKEYILDAPKIDCINVHGSILPKYRGASPIQSCLLNGDDKTGVTIMRMVKGMDAGAIYDIAEYEILAEDVAPVLYEKLALIGGKALIRNLWDIFENGTKPIEQNSDKATYCGKIDKSDGEVDFVNMEATEIWNKYRAYYFWPKIFFFVKGKRVIIHDLEIMSELNLDCDEFKLSDGLCVGTKKGVLRLNKLQMEGKGVVSGREFWRAFKELFT